MGLQGFSQQTIAPVYVPGDKVRIEWGYFVPQQETILVLFNEDGSRSTRLTGDYHTKAGSYLWTIPAGNLPGPLNQKYRLALLNDRWVTLATTRLFVIDSNSREASLEIKKERLLPKPRLLDRGKVNRGWSRHE